MAETSSIEWTDATWTPIRARHRVTGKVGWHCEHASPGCSNCYSETFNERRLGTGLPFKPGLRGDVEHILDEAMLVAPLRWRRPRRIFVCSMTDLFGEWVPDAWISRVFAVMALCPRHTFQVLTKRSARMRDYASRWFERLATGDVRVDHPTGPARFSDLVDWTVLPSVLPNVWLGVSAEDQRRADERVPDLIATSAAVRFVSAEPLLGPMDLHEYLLGFSAGNPAACACGHGHGFTRCPNSGRVSGACHRCDCRSFRKARGSDGLHWIIAGGESGPSARPMHPDWARSLRDQCAAAGVPFLFKQWGAWGPGAGFEAALTAREAYLGEIQTLFVPGSRTIKLAIPTRLDDKLGPALTLERYGKKVAGRKLDGVEHDGMPEAAHA